MLGSRCRFQVCKGNASSANSGRHYGRCMDVSRTFLAGLQTRPGSPLTRLSSFGPCRADNSITISEPSSFFIMALRPIIAICGTTGVGKSKLAIELAAHLDSSSNKSDWRRAKVINADSMQVYKGLDVITNKVPEPERMGIPHLLMGFKQPGEQYVVGEWIQDALKLVSQQEVAYGSLTVSFSLVDKRNA